MTGINGNHYRLLIAELQSDLEAVEKVAEETQNALKEKKGPLSNLELAGIAHLLENFYTAIEDVLLRIASRVDKSLPTGEKWHKDLLFRMTLRIPAIRPPVLDRRLYEVLDEYRRFRHRSRHVYRPPIPDWAKMKHLAENIGDNFQETKRQIGLFIDFLNKLIASLEEEEAEGK